MDPVIPGSPRRILVVRADGIGDHVLAAGLLAPLRKRFPGARITVACPDLVQDLFTACPFVDRVLVFNKRKLHRNPLYRLRIALALSLVRADLVLNTVYSRDSASDLVSRMGWMGRGGIRIGHQGDGHNLRPDKKLKNDRDYTRLVPPLAEDSTELERHQQFLYDLGIPGVVRPSAWISPEDRDAASSLLRRHGLEQGPRLAFFPGTGDAIRFYDEYQGILAAFLRSTRAGLVCLGAAGDRDWAAAILRELPGPKANLCGQTSLSQAAALLEQCRLGFGAETGLAHLAAAVGTPHLVLLGGGFFGRFMPVSALASAVCLPLACYGCGWVCPYERPYCVRDIPPETALEALRATWAEPARGPRLFYPAGPPAPGWPAALDLAGTACGRRAVLVPVQSGPDRTGL